LKKLMLKLGIKSITGKWLNPPSLCIGWAVENSNNVNVFLLIFLIEIKRFN